MFSKLFRGLVAMAMGSMVFEEMACSSDPFICVPITAVLCQAEEQPQEQPVPLVLDE